MQMWQTGNAVRSPRFKGACVLRKENNLHINCTELQMVFSNSGKDLDVTQTRRCE